MADMIHRTVVAVEEIQERRIKKKPQIVTYDWLEDSIDAKRPIPDTDKYDPGQPRDIDGMVAAWKETKFSVKTNADGTARSFRTKTRELKAGEAVTAETNVFKSSAANLGQKAQATVGNKTLASSSTKQPGSAPAASQPKKMPVITVAYKDETDQFAYQIELTAVRPHPNVEKHVLEVIMTTNRVPARFRFREFYYDKQGSETRNSRSPWVGSAKEALDDFRRCFHKRTGYAWERRLLHASKKGGNGGKWYYEVPARGEPRGAVPPEYTPGHPKCVGLPSLLPSATRRRLPPPPPPPPPPAQLAQLGPLSTAGLVQQRATFDPPRTKPSSKTYKKGSLALRKPLKRKLEDCSSTERRTKVQKTT